MDSIGVFTPEQARLLWQEYLSRQQLQSQLTKNYPQRRPLDEPSPHRVFVKNTSGEAIPAFACMQITGTAVYGERTVVNVTKPTTTDGAYLFNSPYEIAIDAAGWAYRFGVVVMLGDPPSESGALYEANPGAWTVVEGSGPFVAYGDYEITPESTVAAVIGTFSSGNNRLQVVLTTDLLAAVNTKRDPSTATARILRRKTDGDLTLSTDSITIVNRFTQISVDAGTYAKAEMIDGEWQLYAADCPGGSASSGSV